MAVVVESRVAEWSRPHAAAVGPAVWTSGGAVQAGRARVAAPLARRKRRAGAALKADDVAREQVVLDEHIAVAAGAAFAYECHCGTSVR